MKAAHFNVDPLLVGYALMYAVIHAVIMTG
jgi:hypothetical protein